MTRSQPTARLIQLPVKPEITVPPSPAGQAPVYHASFGSSKQTLLQIAQPEINLAVWLRDVPAAVAAWLTKPVTTDFGKYADIDERLPASCVPAFIAARFAGIATEQPAGPAALARDVGDLAGVLARLTLSPIVRLRLEWVTEQTCCYFHVDRVPLRLVCTYCGPGTEWVSNKVATCLKTAESVPAQNDINRLCAGDVAVMRGSAEGLRPLTHRSPPIEQPSERRLFLAIDPA